MTGRHQDLAQSPPAARGGGMIYPRLRKPQNMQGQRPAQIYHIMHGHGTTPQNTRKS